MTSAAAIVNDPPRKVNTPDGPRYFPASMSQDEIDAVMREQYPPPPPVDPYPETSFLEKFAQGRAASDQSMGDTFASMSGLEAREQALMGNPDPSRPLYTEGGNPASNAVGLLEGATQLAGNVVGRGADLVGNVAVQGIEELPDGVKDYASGALDALLETSVGKAVLAGLKKGGTAAAAMIEKYPQEAKTLGAAMEVGAILTPTGKVGKETAKYGEKMVLKGKNKRRDDIAQMMVDDNKIGKGKTTQSTLATGRRNVYHPTKNDLAEAEALAAIPKVKTSRSATYNYNHVDEAVTKAKTRLDQDIIKAGDPKIDKDAFMDDLGELVDNFDSMDEALVLSGDASKWGKSILWKAYELIDESDGTTLGLLNARRQLDKWIDRNSGKAYNVDEISGRNVAQTLIRTRINQRVIEAVPDVQVQESLLNQHRLLTALDTLHDKRLQQGSNMFARMMNNLSATHVGPIGGMAIMGSLGGMSGGLFAEGAMVGGGAAGVGLWAAYQAANSATRKKVLGAMLRASGKAIGAADETIVGQLKADRLLLIDMLQAEAATDEE